jgi:CPA2 family monovalent cation:H+ antiporter-2
MDELRDHVIIAGFGVAGRFIAEYLADRQIAFVVIETNSNTCSTQTALGVHILYGDISDESVLRRAGIERAKVLALAIPDEVAALKATEAANRIHPDIHIIAATRYTSTGLQALQTGADEVIVAEQAVAQEFYRRIAAYMDRPKASAVSGA